MNATQKLNSVILAQAGIQRFYPSMLSGFVPALRGSFLFDWIPACTKSRQSTVQQAGRGIGTAGMTNCIRVVNVGWHIDEF